MRPGGGRGPRTVRWTCCWRHRPGRAAREPRPGGPARQRRRRPAGGSGHPRRRPRPAARRRRPQRRRRALRSGRARQPLHCCPASRILRWSCPWIVKPAPRWTGRTLEVLAAFVAELPDHRSGHPDVLPPVTAAPGPAAAAGRGGPHHRGLHGLRRQPAGRPAAARRGLSRRPAGSGTRPRASHAPPASRCLRATTANSGCRAIRTCATWWARSRISWSIPARRRPPGPGPRCTMPPPWNCSRAPGTGWW